MTLPLWFWWVAAAALAWVLLRRGDDARRAWVPAAAIVLALGAVTIDHLRISDDELEDAAQQAADGLDGFFGPLTEARVAIAVEDRLGHAVEVDSQRERSTVETRSTVGFDVSVDGGPRVCIRAITGSPDLTVAAIRFTTLNAFPGACSKTEDK